MHGLAMHSGNSAEFSQHLRLAGDASPSQSPAGSQLTTGPWVSHADKLRAAEAANPKAYEHEWRFLACVTGVPVIVMQRRCDHS